MMNPDGCCEFCGDLPDRDDLGALLPCCREAADDEEHAHAGTGPYAATFLDDDSALEAFVAEVLARGDVCTDSTEAM